MLVSMDRLPADYQHIYLSPHFDDAALSVGGTIARQAAAGERVLVVTVCSAPPRGPLNPFAAHLHERWGGAAEPISVRRTEDEAAVSRLGADLLWLDELDAIYRDPAYASVEAIFAAPAPGDPLPAKLARHLERLRRHLPRAGWYAPLALGNHVDHQIAHQAAAAALPPDALLWYEDLPYAARQDAVEEQLRRLPDARPLVLDIAATLPAKLASIADYASQMVELFGDHAAMEAEIGGYARRIAPDGGERLWQPLGEQPAAEYVIREVDAAEWTGFVAGRPDAHLLQRAEWGALKGEFGWQPQRLVVADRSGILGGAQVLWRSQWGLRVAYVPRGPVWARSEPANALLLQALERLARRRHAVFLRLEPNGLDDGSFDARHSALLLAGFEPAAPTQPEASIHLDLAPAAKDLLAGASKGHRADVRRAERLGVTVRVGASQADLDSFYAIMQATGQRAGFNIHSRDYYAAAWRLFGGQRGDGAARLLLAEFEGAVVAAFLVFASGAEAQYMYSGASEAGLKNGANHALQWAAIQWARSRGSAIYDFWGIPAAFLAMESASDPAERERLEAAAQATGMAGVYRFKKGWGGAVVKYAPAYDRVFLRPAYWIWRKRNQA
ncbi:MAG TPA: peptidoglycan bridge formation glycyltransferase FemA/FemB family protein [Herpetosiphonaceae bacterium]|nr:peptidoglycan bridge formation glycyltransferase FemA/FemB family protein [Herpetosiphonaceae bacterium]